MSDLKSLRQRLRSSSIKGSSSKSKSPTKSGKATVNSVTPKTPSTKVPNMRTRRLSTVVKPGSVTEQERARNSTGRSRLAVSRKSHNDTLRNGMEMIEKPGIEPLSSVSHSNVDLTLEKGSCSQGCKLECDSSSSSDAVLPDKNEMSPLAEFSLSKGELQSDALPTNQDTETLGNQQTATLPSCQCFTVYTCNGEQTKRNCTKSATRMKKEKDIAKILSDTITSLNRKRQDERGKELLRIIELGLDDFREIFNLQPMDEYSSYVLRLCQVELSHAQLQTRDDCLSRETQTERSRTAPYSSWTQIPPDYEGSHSGHVRYARRFLDCCLDTSTF